MLARSDGERRCPWRSTSPATARRVRRPDELIRRSGSPCRSARSPPSTRSPSGASTTSPASRSAFALDVGDGVVERARIGLGGVAATPGARDGDRVGARGASVDAGDRPGRRARCCAGRAPRSTTTGPAPPTAGRCSATALLRAATPRARHRHPRRCARERPPSGARRPPSSAGRSRTSRAALHVTGAALYTDDLVGADAGPAARPSRAGTARPRPRDARSTRSPALAVPGVVRVLTAAGRPGVNDAGVKHDEPLFPSEVMFHGQRLLGARRDARGGPARRRGRRGRLRAAAGRGHGARGDRGRELPGRASRRLQRGDVESGARAGGPRLQRRDRVARARSTSTSRPTAALAHVDEGGQVFVQSQHPAPDRDPGDRRARARPAEQRGHRAVPAHGRRLRRQGDAAARLGRRRRARAPSSPGARCGCGSTAPRT